MGFVADKLFRLREAATLITRYAADGVTRRTLVGIYRSLSRPETYDTPVDLKLKIGSQIFDFRMRLSDIFILGEILFEQQYAMQSTLPSNPVILDAGGNIGISALWFAGHHPGARLHIFEPASDNLVYLENNARHWPGAQVFKQALGAETGEMTLHMGAFGGMHSLMEDAPETGAAEETVPVVTLADHMAAHGIAHVDLLKLDIEGGEMDALIGLGDRIGDVSVIVGEVHEAIIDTDGFYAYLKDHGFKVLWTKRFHGSEEQQVHGFEAARVA